MSFRLVPKSVTLNDRERRNGRYFALFHRTRVYHVIVKQLHRFQNPLLIGLRNYSAIIWVKQTDNSV